MLLFLNLHGSEIAQSDDGAGLSCLTIAGQQACKAARHLMGRASVDYAELTGQAAFHQIDPVADPVRNCIVIKIVGRIVQARGRSVAEE